MNKIDQYTRGVLYSKKSQDNYALTRVPPSSKLSCIVETYWHVSWDLSDGSPHVQQNIPDPCVNIVFEQSATNIVGVVTKRHSVELANMGQIFGIKFQPGGFFSFTKSSVSTLTDRSVKLEDIFSDDCYSLIQNVRASKDIDSMVKTCEDFLSLRMPDSLENVRKIGELISAIKVDSKITKVSQISDKFGLSDRSLQRLFKDEVGVSPKWIIKKYRMQEVLSRLEDGEHDWQSLVNRLGYFDQSHFIKDFKSLIGITPIEYISKLSKVDF